MSESKGVRSHALTAIGRSCKFSVSAECARRGIERVAETICRTAATFVTNKVPNDTQDLLWGGKSRRVCVVADSEQRKYEGSTQAS